MMPPAPFLNNRHRVEYLFVFYEKIPTPLGAAAKLAMTWKPKADAILRDF